MDMNLSCKQVVALKAVWHGCATNKKIEIATYLNRKTGETMSFSDALEIVADIIVELEAQRKEEKSDGK